MSEHETDRSPPIDEWCGRYRLLRRLATGGMGQVFLASLTSASGFEKQVAVKRLLPHLAEEERFVNMFLDEARIAARLSHRNICSVHEVGASRGSYYIAMEYLDGETCSQLLRRVRGPMSPELVTGIIRQASEGLHAAHELRDDKGVSLGVIHRDVTPSNIFVCKSGVVKLLDFGVAKARDALMKTQAGSLKGKFGYMSPEHLKASKLDRRADIFSIGIVTYELLTGKRLFRRESMYLTTKAILDEPIASLTDFGVDAELAACVAKALSREPDERYATALEFGEAIERSVAHCWSDEELRVYVEGLEGLEGPATPAGRAVGSHPTVTNTGDTLARSGNLASRSAPQIVLPPPTRTEANRPKPWIRDLLLAVVALLALVLVSVFAYHLAL